VAPARVDVLPLTEGTAEHLGLYGGMDVSLDPFPYAGTTTTCESLYMGVPVVTLAGARPAPRRPARRRPCALPGPPPAPSRQLPCRVPTISCSPA
jgi:hypothetical protein